MKFTTALPLAFLSAASARIVGVAVPETISNTDAFDVTIQTENYIQTVEDISIAFGLSNYPETLGPYYIGSKYLGPEKSNTLDNITFSLTLPEDVPTGENTFAAALTSLYGASYGPTLQYYNVTINVGNETSGPTVSSLSQ